MAPAAVLRPKLCTALVSYFLIYFASVHSSIEGYACYSDDDGDYLFHTIMIYDFYN
jgi:hypothetical protein